jgi:hypothetical protein
MKAPFQTSRPTTSGLILSERTDGSKPFKKEYYDYEVPVEPKQAPAENPEQTISFKTPSSSSKVIKKRGRARRGPMNEEEADLRARNKKLNAKRPTRGGADIKISDFQVYQNPTTTVVRKMFN